MSPVSFFAEIFGTATRKKYEKYANKTGKLPESYRKVFRNSREFSGILDSSHLRFFHIRD